MTRLRHQEAIEFAERRNTALVVPGYVGALGASLNGSGYSLAIGVAGVGASGLSDGSVSARNDEKRQRSATRPLLAVRSKILR